MKDREILPIRQEGAQSVYSTEVPTAMRVPAVRRRSSTAPDRTTRLLAEILGVGPDRASEILSSLDGLEALAFASEPDLVKAGVSRNRARLVCAAFELARQSIGSRPQIGKRLAGASAVWMHMRARLSGALVEEFWAIALDVRHRVVLDSMIARGSLTRVEIHPRDVFRALIKGGAAAVIFCHNHPSGDPVPSRADIELTERLRQVGEMCGIVVLDHVVVAAGGYASLAERGWQ